MQQVKKIKICIRCGHVACEGCGNWCDIIATNKEEFKKINTELFFKSLSKEEKREWIKEPYHEEWFPILCCEGECVYD